MKISIIVPVYNAENTIEYCVKSILSQNVEDLEVILVDDYSSDHSLEICKQLKVHHKEISLYQTEGKGVSAARNTGLKHITGDIVGFCDADDLFEANAFRNVSDIYIENPELDIVVVGFYYSHFKGKINIDESKTFGRSEYCAGNDLIKLILLNESVLGSVCNKFYKTTILKGILFDEQLSYCEDMYFNAKIIKNNPDSQCFIMDKALYHYMHNENSATNSVDRLFDKDGFFKYSVALDKIASLYNYDKLKNYVLYKKAAIAIDTLYHYKIPVERKQRLFADINKCRLALIKVVFYEHNCKITKLLIKLMVVDLKRNW